MMRFRSFHSPANQASRKRRTKLPKARYNCFLAYATISTNFVQNKAGGLRKYIRSISALAVEFVPQPDASRFPRSITRPSHNPPSPHNGYLEMSTTPSQSYIIPHSSPPSPSATSATSSVDSLPDSASSDDIDSSSEDLEESDAEREWKESLQQLELLLTMVVVPYLGKYFGRKCAYWGESVGSRGLRKATTVKATYRMEADILGCARLGEVHGMEVSCGGGHYE